MKHLLIDISAHGFGHVAQTSAVLNALDCANIRLTIRSLTPEAVLKQRIRQPFTLIPHQQDNGMLMHDALRVDVATSMNWYATFHANYAERKTQAAVEAGIPAIALCSLNWADVFAAYCGGLPGAGKILEEIRHAYARADIFLQPTPSMGMHASLRAQPIAPIAAIGQRHPALLREKSSLPDHTRFVLVALGGLGMTYPLENWPRLPGVCWIFPDEALHTRRDDFLPTSLFGMRYADLLASCDAVITKTGYGTQTEAVVNQIPALCILRDGWPEEPNLPDWHARHGEVEFTDWAEIQKGAFGQKILALLETPWQKPAVKPCGAPEAAAILHKRLQAV